MLLAAFVLALLVLPALGPAPAHAQPPSSMTVADTVGAVDPERLMGQLADVDFRRKVDLVILVLDVTDLDVSVAQDTALNDAVLAYSRDSAPELLSADGQHWANRTVIIALDPENRFLGAYGGEDVTLNSGGFETVQEAMRDEAAEGDWEESLLAGATKYASLLDRPWWQSPAAIVAGLGVVGGVVITAVAVFALRGAARRRVDAALPRFQDVLSKRRATDTAATTLPRWSPYAIAALQDHQEYLAKVRTAEELHAQLPEPSQRTWGWGLKGSQRKLSRDFESTVAYLDDIDDDIISTCDLLHRIGTWRESWERELEPLRDSIEALDDTLFDGGDMSPQEAAAAADLRELGGDISLEMDSLTTGLEADEIDPDTALERLDTLTRELSAAVAALRELSIARLATDEDEGEVLRDSLVDDDAHEYRSVRGRRHLLESGPGDPDSSDGIFWHLSPLLWYSSWHTESDNALESYRNPSSSSGGSVSGFSSGFAGAGSSSRF